MFAARHASSLLRSLAAVGLFLEIDIGEGLTLSVPHDKTGRHFVDRPRCGESAGRGWHGQIIGRSGSQKKPRHRVPRLKRFDKVPLSHLST